MSLSPAQQDVTKLPKWVQQRIAKLEADVDYWQKKALAVANGDSSAFLQVVVGNKYESLALPDDRVRYRLKDGTEIDVSLNAKETRLEVRTANGRLLVMPDASNAIGVIGEQFMSGPPSTMSG